jgi:hypothetical protein
MIFEPYTWPVFAALAVGAVLVAGIGLFALWILAQLADILRPKNEDVGEIIIKRGPPGVL